MSWFEHRPGFQEISHEQVRRNMQLRGEYLHSRLNGRAFQCGRLELLSFRSTRRPFDLNGGADQISIREVIGDVRKLHMDPQNTHALFQAASQFSFLKWWARALARRRGFPFMRTIIRRGRLTYCCVQGWNNIRGTTLPRSMEGWGRRVIIRSNSAAKVGELLGNTNGRLWEMRNGYALATCARG